MSVREEEGGKRPILRRLCTVEEAAEGVLLQLWGFAMSTNGFNVLCGYNTRKAYPSRISFRWYSAGESGEGGRREKTTNYNTCAPIIEVYSGDELIFRQVSREKYGSRFVARVVEITKIQRGRKTCKSRKKRPHADEWKMNNFCYRFVRLFCSTLSIYPSMDRSRKKYW